MVQAINVLAVAVVVATLAISETSARSGCASFGHSCYGGIGKRGDVDSANEETIKNGAQDNETPAAAYAFKESGSQGATFARPLRYLPMQSEQINRYIRQWIINYWKREEELEQK